jgi:transcriptional regulator with XRE-family HTH domain
MTDLQRTILDAAERQGINKTDLAKCAGVTRQTLANWMAGRNQISVGAVERIMERLGLVVTEVNQ